jgi:hypothetical protein
MTSLVGALDNCDYLLLALARRLIIGPVSRRNVNLNYLGAAGRGEDIYSLSVIRIEGSNFKYNS